MDPAGDTAERQVLSQVDGAYTAGGSSTPSRPVPQGPLGADFLTIFAAPHGGAVDSLVLFVVECVAIPVHGVVEKCEIAAEEEYGVRGLCWAPLVLRGRRLAGRCAQSQLSFVDGG